MKSPILVILAAVLLTNCRQAPTRAPEGIWLTEVGSGPVTVIMLHGGPGLTHRYLRPEWDQLADGARLVYYDQRGCGWSERTDSVTWQHHVADLDSMVVSVQLDGPVVLAGSSWGSTLGVLYAYTHPDRVAALVLSGVPDLAGVFYPRVVRDTVDASVYSRGWQGPGVRIDSTVAYGDSTVYYFADSTTKTVRVATVQLGDPPPVKDSAAVAADTISLRPEFAARMGMACPGASSSTWVSLRDSVPQLDALSLIDMPVLIVRGTEPTRVGDGSEQLAAALPNARVETIPQAGHDPWFEQPHTFFDVVRDFLAESDSP